MLSKSLFVDIDVQCPDDYEVQGPIIRASLHYLDAIKFNEPKCYLIYSLVLAQYNNIIIFYVSPFHCCIDGQLAAVVVLYASASIRAQESMMV